MQRFKCWLAILICILSPSEALANLGLLSNGGAAHLLTKNSTVSMQSEVININVRKEQIEADCNFTFVNHGPKCTVRVGFPDSVGWNASKGNAPDGRFLSYKLTVDGREIEASVIQSDRPHVSDKVWHASEVTFEENETKHLRNVYITRPNTLPVTEQYGVKFFEYTLHTAASWKGTVDTSVVNITLSDEAIREPLNVVSVNSLPEQDVCGFDWSHATTSTVLVQSSKQATISGRTLRFEFKDLSATDADDISIYYRRMSKGEAERFFERMDEAPSRKTGPAS
jgi:hypothetical protein